MTLFKQIYDAVLESYIGDKPAWMVDYTLSTLKVVSRHEIEGMDEGDVQEMFRSHHVLVKDQFQPTLAFDENGLKTLADLRKPVTLQGECVSHVPLLVSEVVADLSKENEFKTSSLHKQGTLQDLLDCHRGDFKIVNGLDFPMPSAPHPPTSMASDLAAFIATLDLPFCGRNVAFPVMSTRWGLAATTGAFHLWHTDCNGFGTYIDTQVGFKWWVVGRPKEPSDFSDIALFTSGKFQLNGPNGDLWSLEAVLLVPGSRLYACSTDSPTSS